MIPVEEAQERVLAEVELLGTEQVAFTEAHGRVLREDVHRARSTCRTATTRRWMATPSARTTSPSAPVTLRVIEESAGGNRGHEARRAGHGDPHHDRRADARGADTVAHVEITDARIGRRARARAAAPRNEHPQARRGHARGRRRARATARRFTPRRSASWPACRSRWCASDGGRRWPSSPPATRSSTSATPWRPARSSTRTRIRWPRSCAKRARFRA